MNASTRAHIFVILVALPATALAQVASGHRVFGPLNGTDTHLVDAEGQIVQTWPSTYLPGAAVYVLEDGSLLRAIRVAGGPSIGGVGGGVQRVALDGTVLWDYRYSGPEHWSHHDLEPMPNGNVLIMAWDHKAIADAIAAGRDPSLIQGGVMRPDSIIEVQQTGATTGAIVWEWHVWDHLIQDFDATRKNYGSVRAHPELVDINYPPTAGTFNDWNHMNSVKYDPVHDRIMLSAREQNEIWVIDHSTTTAEAAGHVGGRWNRGGDLLYRYGNPEAYRAGSPADRVFFGQHCARFIPPGYPGAGNFTVFNNNPPMETSQVLEFVPPLDAAGNFILPPGGGAFGPTAPVWKYTEPGNFNSVFTSSAERLPNGNTLICSGGQGALFEVTQAGQVVWYYLSPGNASIFQTHYVERTLWTSTEGLSSSTGGAVTFDAITGSPYAGQVYLFLASASGTYPGIQAGGITVPLNFDPIMMFTFEGANSLVLSQTFGSLDTSGRATATLNLPPNVINPGVVHFACIVVDPAPTVTILGATNPVPLKIMP